MKKALRQYILDNFDSALENGRIQVYYQPVIRTISGQLCSFEALARWVDPERGLLSPDAFIPVLEEAGRIHELDGYVIGEVCRRIRLTVERGETPIPVSVNLSRLDFLLCDIFSVVDRHVSAYQVPHDFLYIEITESVMAEQEGLMHTVVDRFHEAGYQVWMDDFGSGYSSLNMLKDYPFDELKMDMRFLSSFNQRSLRILTSVIQMAKEIDIHTLVEGVETEEQFVYLRNIGCEKVQGFFFGRPLPFDEAIAQLKARNIPIEPPRDRKYYDDIGRLNFLSSAPFLSPSERKKLTTGRTLNSIPLALAEMRKDDFSLLFCNQAFEQNVGNTVLLPDIFRPEQLGMSHPYSVIPARIGKLLESTRSQGTGRMLFVSNEEYYELKAKCVARRRGAYCVLLQLNNLSQESQSASTSVLDEGLRQIYTLFERIILVDLKKDCLTPLYVGTKDYLTSRREGLTEIAQSYARELVFPDDREAFLRFWEADTLEQRLTDSRLSSLSALFRCLVGNGRYEWKQFLLLRYRPGIVVELVRSAHREMERFELRASLADRTAEACSPALLWSNLIHSNVARLFWKDRDRRFLGVNRGFLEYYGFFSPSDVIGKNDEELGWHVHPDLYMNDEYRVITEGITTHNVPGRCICNGENREILANKTPLYDEEGDIIGLLGCFIDRDLLNMNDPRGVDTTRRDEMTGLLNSRGLHEQVGAFKDEYFLRNTDFMCLQVSIDDLKSINDAYGFDFGDKVISALGRELKKAFGRNSAVARINGFEFVVLRQVRDKTELSALRDTIRRAAENVHEIDGTPTTIYLSMGYALFSESEDFDEMMQSAEMRLLVDHDDHAPSENLQLRTSTFFRLYDDLPISYAVYKVRPDARGEVTDAVLFYGNHRFERSVGRPLREMLGHGVKELFPTVTEKWLGMAERAALKGETIIENLYFDGTDKRYYLTANQIIRQGYCAFTYQEIDLSGELVETAEKK